MYYHVMCHQVSDHVQLVPNCHMSPSFRSCSELDASFEISQHGRHTINRAQPRHQLWKHSDLILVRKSASFNVALILIKDAPTFEHNLVAKPPPNRTQQQHRISQHWRHTPDMPTMAPATADLKTWARRQAPKHITATPLVDSAARLCWCPVTGASSPALDAAATDAPRLGVS